ncbi:LLM class flavin-dependent oxidoreductase [Myxococcota bacterium]|nr:LLM class flavin-dependent oxidoreductase [Myxococcota bacterium]
MARLHLSALDQSPVRRGESSAIALSETVRLGILCDDLGYERFWVAEHHNLPGFAGTSPEVLIGAIAAQTNRIRVGSGGVMLSHYSSLHVAESFRVLESLHPGRIDLGLGRAPGSDPRTAAALAYPGEARDVRHYPEQIDDLVSYLGPGQEGSHPFSGIKAAPTKGSVPEVWLLGSGIDSALLAAERGLPYAYAHFFGASVDHGPAIVDAYRTRFEPSSLSEVPKVMLAVQVICAETSRRAYDLSLSLGLARLLLAKGVPEPIASVTDASAYPYSSSEKAFVEQFQEICVLGTEDEVEKRLELLSEQFETDEFSVVTVCHDFESRCESYRLLAKRFGLKC